LFEVFGEAAIAAEPCESSLYDPSAREQDEALCRVGSFDDLECPAAAPLERGLKLLAGVSAIGEDMAQPWEARPDRRQDIGRAIAVLNVSGVDDRCDQQAQRIG